MKPNKYDDPAFFANYSQMARSIGGLDAAGNGPPSARCFPSSAIKTCLILAAALAGTAAMRANSRRGQWWE